MLPRRCASSESNPEICAAITRPAAWQVPKQLPIICTVPMIRWRLRRLRQILRLIFEMGDYVHRSRS